MGAGAVPSAGPASWPAPATTSSCSATRSAPRPGCAGASRSGTPSVRHPAARRRLRPARDHPLPGAPPADRRAGLGARGGGRPLPPDVRARLVPPLLGGAAPRRAPPPRPADPVRLRRGPGPARREVPAGHGARRDGHRALPGRRRSRHHPARLPEPGRRPPLARRRPARRPRRLDAPLVPRQGEGLGGEGLVSSSCRPTTGPRAPAPTPPTPPTSRAASPPTSTSSGPAPSSATTTSPPRRPARPPTCSGGSRSSGSTTPRTTRSASPSSSRRTDSPATDLAPETAGLLLNSTRQVGLARLDALIVAAYLADPASYDHERAVHQAVVDLLGEAAAPPFERLMDAWRAVPDVRTLTQDLQAGGRPFLDALLARLRPALATLDEVMPQLDVWPRRSSDLERACRWRRPAPPAGRRARGPGLRADGVPVRRPRSRSPRPPPSRLPARPSWRALRQSTRRPPATPKPFSPSAPHIRRMRATPPSKVVATAQSGYHPGW